MKKKEINSARVPVYRDSGFELHDAGTTSAAFTKETEHSREPDTYIYSRYRNPTVVAAEEEVMKVEKCDWALLTETGMAAIDTAVSIFQKGADTKPWLFFTEIYGGTISYINSVLRDRRGLSISTFGPVDGKYNLVEFEKMIKELRPAFVYAETISNPLLVVADIPELCRIARKYDARVIVDNTFASPYLFRPLEHGADIVIHSATKYLSGHGNLTAGAICGNDTSLMKQAIEYRKFTGHMLSPDDAYRLSTQILTFRLRFEQQCKNASMMADLFRESAVISRVFYPRMKDHPTCEISARLFGGKLPGGMLTIDFKGANAGEMRMRRDKFIAAVSETIKLIPTLGDPHTILMPVEAVWGAKYPEPGMLRISAGFEESGELKTVVVKALERL
ncbi:MAG TPA: PLP-dependent aspartate aminotransferase family protein [Bacteroidales bacterium]|nr:PLP-dependent aspartate aminotransferase family protein [Bacteroidales bacterium]